MYLPFCFLLFIAPTASISWNWILTNPHHFPMTSQRDDPLPLSDFPRRDLVRPHPKSSHRPEFLGITALETPANHRRLTAVRRRHACLHDTDCSPAHYCDEHYLRCRTQHELGEACRYDGQCVDGAQCDQGFCLPMIEDGKQGSRCDPSTDSCDPGLCCAASFGQHVCKPRPQRSDYCYVPDGGSDYILEEMCPCDTGLVCAQTTARARGRELSWLSEWNNARKYRCVPQ